MAVFILVIQMLLTDAVTLLDRYPNYKTQSCSFFLGLDTSTVTDLEFAFASTAFSCEGDQWQWDVSRVTSLTKTFFAAASFNANISSWDVSRVATMAQTFNAASAFNGDLLGWDVSQVTNMYHTFDSMPVFAGDISSWDVSQVASLEATFYLAQRFNADISGWDVGQVKSMYQTFYEATVFTADISGWDVSQTTNMDYTLHNAILFSGDLRNWCTAAVITYTGFCSGGCMQPIWGTCPTVAPTRVPTSSPILEPSGTPAPAPTLSPTSGTPTTGTPTPVPTLSPTSGTPTSTGTPTPVPTLSPTSRTPTTGTPTPVPTLSPTSGPTSTVVAPPSLTVVESVQVLRSVPFEGPFLAPNATLIVIQGQHHESDDFVSVSSVVEIVLTLDGVAVPVGSLQEPIVFVLNITSNITDTQTTCVTDGRAVVVPVVPECVFWNTSEDVWSSAGCKASNVTPTTVTCRCSHLTEFTISLPSVNELTEVRGLRDLGRFPTTLIVLLLVLAAFGGGAAAASVVDRYKDSAEKEAAKRQLWSWKQQQGQGLNFVRFLKAGFQHGHPWFAVCFRQSGSSFLSVDRCLVLLVLVMCNMATTAAFWSRPSDEFLVRCMVSSFVSFSTYEVLEQLFKRCGALGFREQWERDQQEAPVNAFQIVLHYRFPEYVRTLLRLLCLCLVCFLSVIILLYGVKFDLNPAFFCDNADGARSWLLTFLVVTIVDILVYRPIKLVASYAIKFYIKKRRQEPAAAQRLQDLETDQEPTNPDREPTNPDHHPATDDTQQPLPSR